MAQFDVLIEEKLCRIITVEAEDWVEAEDIVSEMYHDGEIVLDYSDFNNDVVIEAYGGY